MSKVKEEVFDENGNFLSIREIESGFEPDWKSFRFGFFSNVYFSKLRLKIKEQGGIGEIYFDNIKELSASDDVPPDIFIEQWNLMIDEIPLPITEQIITQEVVKQWSQICEDSFMQFIVLEDGRLELVESTNP